MPSPVLALVLTTGTSPPKRLDHDLAVGELLQDAVGVDPLLVDLVHGDDDRHARRADVLDRLLGLRHDPVVGGDHQDGDIGDIRSTGAHRGEGLVTRGVDERDQAAVALHLVSADHLGDPTGLPGGDLGLADGVEQRRLAMVDMAEHRDHGRARHQRAGRRTGQVEQRMAAPSGRRWRPAAVSAAASSDSASKPK